jgi:hypothetical protein
VAKQRRGCAFFISQVTYSSDAAKSMVSDYFYACRELRLAPRPVLFTLSVCGSVKTLAFLKLLGVDVPRWTPRRNGGRGRGRCAGVAGSGVVPGG